MTPAPTPPEPVGDWAAWSAAMHARLHPARPAYPTHDELHRYAVAWGHADAAILTDWREWEKLQDETLEIIRKMSVDLGAARAERDALRSRLAELEAWIKVAKDWIPDDAARDDLDRLTRGGGGR